MYTGNALVSTMVRKQRNYYYNAGDSGSIPGLGTSPGGGNGNPLQYSCLENPMERGAFSPRGRKESDMTERLYFSVEF